MVNGYIPETLREPLEIRATHHVIPYAGGTDLMIKEPREKLPVSDEVAGTEADH